MTTKMSDEVRLVSLPIPKGWHLYCHDLLRSDDGMWLITPYLSTASAITTKRSLIAMMERTIREESSLIATTRYGADWGARKRIDSTVGVERSFLAAMEWLNHEAAVRKEIQIKE